MDERELPLTRRALHRAPRPGLRVVLSLVMLRAAARAMPPSPRVHRHSGTPRRVVLRRVSTQAIAAAAAAAFVAGGVGAASLDTFDREQAAAAVAAATHQARVDRAATLRLTAGAAQYAAARETEALAAAHAALAEADVVLADAAAMIGEASVSPLNQAAAELSALLDAAEPAHLLDADALAAEAVAPTAATVADPAPGPAPTDAPPDQGVDQGAADPEPVVGTVEPTAPATDAPTGTGGDAKAGGTAGATVAELEATSRAVLGVPEVGLDLEDSAHVLAVAEEVAALSTQVKQLADGIAAELAAAEVAAEAQRAAERAAQLAAIEAAARNLRTRVAATDAAPNGAIPLRLLCGVGFADGALLRCDAAAALKDLNAAYRRAFGRDLDVASAYRDLAGQVAAREAKGDLAATPGTSQHGRGLAVDFSGFGSVGQFDDADYLWMAAHAPAYGWVHPPAMGPGGSGPLEPWHWEFGTL